MKKNYNQPEVLVANVAMISFLCASPATVDLGFTIDPDGDAPGDAL